MLAGASASEAPGKLRKNELMASASRRFLFETIEPRVLLSADLAPGAMVHNPGDIEAASLSLPPVAPLYMPASDVRVLPAAPTANPAPALPNTPADVVAANFQLHIEGAGSAAGSYQFRLPDPGNASPATGNQSNNSQPTYDPSQPPIINLAATNTVLPAADASTMPGDATPAVVSQTQPAPSAATAPKAVAFVDSALPDYQDIVKAISSGDQASNTDIVVLDSTKSEIQQITDALAGRHDISAIHIFSHGFEANLDLGATRLDAAGLDVYASQLSSWSTALRPGADILLYGCDIGAGDDGTAFINRLSELTGANVAASTDDTGATQFGGNWTLEKSTGAIEAALPASASALASYDHLLATVQWTGGGDGATWSDSRNWSGGVVPGASDSVVIAAASGDPAITMTSASGVVKLASLNSSRPITIASGATLQATTVDISRNITLAGGTIQGGTITASSGAVIAVSANNTSGTLSGVTLNGDASVTGSSSTLRINNGFTLNGTVHLAVSGAELRSFGNETFNGNGTISFEGTTGGIRRVTIEGTSTLTLASTFTIAGGYASVGDWEESNGTKALINNGLIASNVSGQTLSILPNGSFTNAGTIDAVGGGVLTVTASSWTNPGTIQLDSNSSSTVNLGGSFDTTGGLGTISRAGGVVNLTGTLLNTGATVTLNATTGSWNFSGIVSGGTVTFADGAALLMTATNVSGTFSNGVTLNGDLTISGSGGGLFVSGGLTLNGTIHLTGSSAHVSSLTNQTFRGNGTVSFEGTSGGTCLLTIEGTSTLTLASTFKVAGGNGTIGDWWSNNGTRTLINNGLISANVAGRTLTILPNGTFTNAATMEAVAGGILALTNSWNNTGTLHIDSNAASTVNLGGAFATAAIGVISRAGGVVNLTGTLTNTGSTLLLNAATGSWNFASGTINGGTVTFADGAALLLATSNVSGTFNNGVTLNGDLTISGSGAGLFVGGGLTLNGTIHLTGSSAHVSSLTNQTFGGNGTVSFEGTSGGIRLLTIEGTSTLTLDTTFKVVGGYGSLGDWWSNNGTRTLINNGLISANVAGQTLTILPSGSFTNNATMEAVGGGVLTLTNNWSNAGTLHVDSNAASTVNFGGTFATNAIGTMNRAGGIVNLAGTVTNTGATLLLNATTGSWNFAGGTINGGTVTFADGATLLLATSNVSGTFTNGVTLNGDLTISGSGAGLFVGGGLTLNGTIHLTGSSAHVSSLASQTFGGNGTVSFEGISGGIRLLTIEGTSTLTLASTFKVAGGYGSIGDWWSNNGTRTLINNGLISSNEAGQTLTILPSGSFTNNATMEAVGGGVLTLTNNWSNAGTLHVDSNAASTVNFGGTFATSAIGTMNRAGGIVNLTGTVTNTGATLLLNATTGSWNFAGGTINGGTVTFADGTALLLATSNVSGTFNNGVTLNGDLTISGSGAGLFVGGGLTLNGTIHLTGSSAHVSSLSNQTFTGNGTISFEGVSGGVRLLTIEGTSTLTLDTTFKVVGGYGSLGDWWSNNGTRTLINNGLISANVAGQALTIVPTGAFTNTAAGTVEAVGGGIVTLTNSWSNAGTLHIDANASSTINLAGSFTTAGIGTINRAGGVVNLTGTLINTGATLTLNATTGSWNFAGGTVSGGTVVFAGGAALLLAVNNVAGTFTNGVTLNGDLLISGSGAGLWVSGGLTLNGTIHMTGSSSHVSSLTSQTFTGNGTISFEGTSGGIRELTIEGTSTLTLDTTFKVVGGYGSVGDWWSNNGTRNLVNNGTITANVTGQSINVIPNGSSNFANGTLTGGTWQAVNGSILRLLMPSAVAVNAANILMDGASSSFVRDNGSTSALSGLIGNAAGGSLTIQNGYDITTAGDFINAGAITIGGGSILALTGAFTQTSGSVNLQGGAIGNMAPPSGNALHFDGNDFVEMADSPTLHSSSDLTISGWFKADGFPRTWQNIFFKGDAPDTISNGPNREFGLWLNSAGYLDFSSTPVSQVNTAQDELDTASGLIKAGQWYHFDAEISASGNFMRLYLNGELVAQRAYDPSGIRDNHRTSQDRTSARVGQFLSGHHRRGGGVERYPYARPDPHRHVSEPQRQRGGP
ncbi:MAG: DUF4347 domain-containing protein [Bradyrhizobium sp.]